MKRLLIYIVLMTNLITVMDWKPQHYEFVNGHPPAFDKHAQPEQSLRWFTSAILCPPCAVLNEQYIFAYMEMDATPEEISSYFPEPYTGNPINPFGDWTLYFNGKKMSLIAFYLYYLPHVLIWWLVVGRLFRPNRLASDISPRTYRSD